MTIFAAEFTSPPPLLPQKISAALLGMTLGDLASVEYPFIAITPKSTLTQWQYLLGSHL